MHPGGGELDEGEAGEEGADEGGDKRNRDEDAGDQRHGGTISKVDAEAAEASTPAGDRVEQAADGAEGRANGLSGIVPGCRVGIVCLLAESDGLVCGRIGVLDDGEGGEELTEGVAQVDYDWQEDDEIGEED